jgi:ubiquinone/menaquinone biosynthesis C-methylase UbiE
MSKDIEDIPKHAELVGEKGKGETQEIDFYSKEIDAALEQAATIVKTEGITAQSPVFDIRAKLYELALKLAPHARDEDIKAMHEWIDPQKGEVSIDIAAGTGFLTKHLVRWTQNTVYAVDFSKKQLEFLANNIKSEHIKPVVGSLAQEPIHGREGILNQIKEPIDIITSFGGIHHVYYQKKMMEHAEKLLKPGGRFVAADVPDKSPLSKHFDDVVTRKCLTSHTARWLSKERIEDLIADLPTLSLYRIEKRTQHWIFSSKKEMALFFKGLHAYNLPEDEVIFDLYDALGFKEENGKIVLNWPMLFFDIRKS